jgi:hypothetical protein
LNTKHGSILMIRNNITQSKVGKNKGLTNTSNSQDRNSSSNPTFLRINQNNENCNKNYTRTYGKSSSDVEVGHHIIKSSSVSALSRMNATSVWI